MQESNYGLLRAALARHFTEACAIEPCAIAPEKTLVRAAMRAGHGIHLPSQETAREYLERYAASNGIEALPLEYDHHRYWRDYDRDKVESRVFD